MGDIILSGSSAASGGGAVTVADGADVAEGATTDAAVITDTNGTLSAKLRGLVKLLGEAVGFEGSTSNGQRSIQIGGSNGSASDEWHAVYVRASDPAGSDKGLVVRDPTSRAGDGNSFPSQVGAVGGYDATNAVNRALRLRTTIPSGASDFGVITRPYTMSDGTNTMPTMDAGARAGYQNINSIPFATRSDTYTVAASGTAINRTTSPLKDFGIQVTGTTAAAALWDVRLEGSLDGVNFTQIVQHTNTTGDKVTKWLGTTAPILYFRSRCDSITLGSATNIVVVILGIA